jgi:hypothetical protein
MPGNRFNALGYAMLETETTRWFFRLDQWEALEHAIDTSAEWFTGDDIYGTTIRVRLACVETAVRYPPEALTAMRDDQEPDDPTEKWKAGSST